MKKLVLPFFAALVILGGCEPDSKPKPGTGPGTENPVTGVAVTYADGSAIANDTVVLSANGTENLKVTLQPAGVSGTVTWSQGNVYITVTPAQDNMSAAIEALEGGEGQELAITVSATNSDNTAPATRTITVTVSEADPGDPVHLEDLDWGTRKFTAEWQSLTPGSTTRELNLNFASHEEDHGTVTKVRFYGGEYDFHEATGTMQDITRPATYSAFKRHRATVTGLKPDTEYQYWLSCDGVNWSDEFAYKTPKADSFRFVALSDPQLIDYPMSDPTTASYPSGTRTPASWTGTIGKISEANPDFIVCTGDHIDTTDGSKSIAEYGYLLNQPLLKSVPWAPTVGNHDRQWAFDSYFNMPNELEFEPLMGADWYNAGNEEYAYIESVGHYWYRYNNALFVVLNTSANVFSGTDAAIPFIERFEETLTRAKAASPGYTWLIVQHHKSSTCIGEHCGDGDIYRLVYQGLEELMTTHGVDFVLSGHDHGYTRSYPMTGKKGGTPSVPDKTQDGSAIDKPNGTIYLTLGTATGVKYYNTFTTTSTIYPFLADGNAGMYYLSATNKPVANNIYNYDRIPKYTVVDVEGSRVTFNTYHVNNTTPVDSFTVTK